MTRIKKALITGCSGQDGSYLAELLLEKGYIVAGMMRRQSSPQLHNLMAVKDNPRFGLVSGDLTDPASVRAIVGKFRPHEIYNLGAMSFVQTSWEQPILTQDVNFLGLLTILEAVRDMASSRQAHIYQASTSEMFGNVPPPQKETDAMIPHSPYGVSKLAAHRMAKVYRDSHGLFVSCGILFNHESPRRGIEFVTRKIANGVARIKAGKQDKIKLGNLKSKRDWGHAKDYVRAMWMMLQQDEPDDFVIGTGVSYSVGDFVDAAFMSAGFTNWNNHVEIDPKYFRPVDIKELRADASKARQVLGWKPVISFENLAGEMVFSEMARLEAGSANDATT